MREKTSRIVDKLVGGLEHFSHILGIILPTSFIFFRGIENTNQINMKNRGFSKILSFH